jgi:hypothetical protein
MHKCGHPSPHNYPFVHTGCAHQVKTHTQTDNQRQTIGVSLTQQQHSSTPFPVRPSRHPIKCCRDKLLTCNNRNLPVALVLVLGPGLALGVDARSSQHFDQGRPEEEQDTNNRSEILDVRCKHIQNEYLKTDDVCCPCIVALGARGSVRPPAS